MSTPDERRTYPGHRGLSGGLLAPTLGSLLLAAACANSPADTPPEAPSPTSKVTTHETPSDDGEKRIVFLGDSLTAGFGLDEAQAFPAVIAETLAARGHRVRIVNAGVSGDTTAGGLARLEWILRAQPDVLVVGLGANDGLRGLSVAMTEENLRSIIERARQRGVRTLLLGMKLPPNMGPNYVATFEAVYPRLAAELEVPLLPFLLAGVAAVPELNLPDGIHPNAAGQRRVAANVLPLVEQALTELDGGKPADAAYSGAASAAAGASPEPDLSATLSSSNSTDS